MNAQLTINTLTKKPLLLSTVNVLLRYHIRSQESQNVFYKCINKVVEILHDNIRNKMSILLNSYLSNSMIKGQLYRWIITLNLGPSRTGLRYENRVVIRRRSKIEYRRSRLLGRAKRFVQSKERNTETNIFVTISLTLHKLSSLESLYCDN